MAKSIEHLEEEIQRLNQELSILSTIGRTVNQSVDLYEILNNGLDRIREMTLVSRAGCYLVEESQKDLVLAAQRGCSKSFTQRFRRRPLGDGGLTGKVALTGEPLYVEDYASHPEALPLAVEEGVKSLVIIPLKSTAKIFGTLNIEWQEPHCFTPQEKNLFNSIGQIIGSALERAFLYTENVRRLEEQKTLHSISQEIASRLELKIILQKIMESAVELLGVEAGEIYLWDNRKQNYVSVIVYGLPESLVGREIPHERGGIVAEVCAKKAPVVYEDYENDPNRWRKLDSYHFKGVLGIPLIVRQMIIGTMVVATSDPRKQFQQKETELLSNLANHAAIAIGNAKLYEDSLDKIRQLTSLYEIGKTLSSTLDLDELLIKALELLKEHLGIDRCAFLFVDRAKDELYIKQIVGKSLEGVKQRRFRIGIDGIVGWVAHTGEPIHVPDVSKDPRYIGEVTQGRSEAAFPLKVRDQVIGVMDVESKESRGFDGEDLKVLSSFASQVSTSIENARLFSELRQTLRELKQAQDQIVQAEKLRALGEMASGVAHDFNNVLAVILGNIQLLLFQLNKISVEEVRDQLRIIERASKDAAETVRRIQDFTGMRRDREFISVPMTELIMEVVTLTQPKWKDQTQAKGIQIELKTQLEEVPMVFGNPSELKEVVTNILFNAVEAMPRGGQVTLATRSVGHWVEVTVSDTGTGMEEDVRKRVFDPFFTTKGVTNSGLGMSVSFGIVKRHGGEILIESEPGKGATFTLHLPMVPFEEERSEEAPAPKEVRSARILVIDDEASVRDILSRMLKIKGHDVVLASCGEEGIERVKSEHFDLVLTDLGMAKITGWDVGKTVKALNAHIPVGMITGWGMELSREKMNENGIDLVISKPFHFDQVIQLVSEALELKERM